LADTNNTLYHTFNAILEEELRSRIQPEDIICLPFGYAHEQAIRQLPHAKVETGIGYPTPYQPFRIYESNAWYHYHLGKAQMHRGSDYHWVIPNYYDITDWDYTPTPERKLVYFGRIGEIKGLQIVWEIAKHRPDIQVVICGQGDPTPYLTLPNISYHPPLHGKERSEFLGNAMAVLMPTRYVEPFGGVTVEAQMTGTPVLGSTYGSFTETIDHGVNGYRCATLGDYLKAIDNIDKGKLNREYISMTAKHKYNMFTLAHDYDKVFQQVGDVHDKGWYTLESHWVD
jgi:glycosyltransferase involved in cell wall biosynthesis